MVERLDLYMVSVGLTESRQKAQTLIKNRRVTVNGTIAQKPSLKVSDADVVEITGDVCEFVGRGGLKLKKALQVFPIEVKDRVCIDIGASTGGFTDCLLQNGAAFVYALDVGHGQLSPKLLADHRVKNMEGINIREISSKDFDKPITLAVCDVSFISLKLVIPHMRRILSENSEAVVLIKPQFEAGKEHVKKGGIVKNKKIHASVIESVMTSCLEHGFSVNVLDHSPIKGGSGNIEYLLYLSVSDAATNSVTDIKKVVETAFSQYDI